MSAIWGEERRQHIPVVLSRKEVKKAASVGLPWAHELVLLFPIADRFYAFLKQREDDGGRTGLYPCPVCYAKADHHDLERLVMCGTKHYQREECEHDWAYDYMGGDICRKCGKLT